MFLTKNKNVVYNKFMSKVVMESNQVIESLSNVMEWVNEKLSDPDLSFEDAKALSFEFYEWIETDEIDLLYLEKF